MTDRSSETPPEDVPRDSGAAESWEPDPTFLHTRREAIVILISWVVCLLWTIGYCGWRGYGEARPEVATILGIPSWVIWGVVLPWAAAILFSVWFSLSYMRDDDLGKEGEAAERDTRSSVDDE